MIDPDSLMSISSLQSQGFSGFVRVADLRSGNQDNIPDAPGVYLVLRDFVSHPDFLEVGTGGHFKRKDPNVPIARLTNEWVEQALIVYVGQSGSNSDGTLRKRIGQLIDFGQGKPVGHWGGRLMWQLQGADRLLVCWKEVVGADPEEPKKELIKAFKSGHSRRRPFANLRG